MSQYILINRIKVQNANAIAGFTWGFPAVTHFLGFTHNLSRKLLKTGFKDIRLTGCAVISHEHQVHAYDSSFNVEFTQSRNPPYLKSHERTSAPPVIEEGKMNMTVSLLIGYKGDIGNRESNFKQWLDTNCLLQRLAGGTVLSIADIDVYGMDDKNDLNLIKRKLLPGFILMDRSEDLEVHYQELLNKNVDSELLDAWLDFSSLKQKSRPKSNLISKHLNSQLKNYSDNEQYLQLVECWGKHLETPYEEGNIPEELKIYFSQIDNSSANEKLLTQWQNYREPTEKIDADWEYVPKPKRGYLVPIMTGYKAISKVYPNKEVSNTRDNETDVCFVEPVHSVGEWLSVHRLRSPEEFSNCLWHYHYEENWYLCEQNKPEQSNETSDLSITNEIPEEEF